MDDKNRKKEHEKMKILSFIRRNQTASKSSISAFLNMSIPAVSVLIDEMLSDGIIEKMGFGKSTGGRKPIIYRISSDIGYVLGVDCGRTHITSVLTTLSGEILKQDHTLFQFKNGDNNFIDDIIEYIDSKWGSDKRFQERGLGIGVSLPGLIDPPRGITYSLPNAGRGKEIRTAEILERKLNKPVLIENDARAFALSERWYGKGINCENFIAINLGYGIGAGMIIGGELFRGKSGFTGEFGHTTVNVTGELCNCGTTDCLEAQASGSALIRKSIDAINRDVETVLAEIYHKNKSLSIMDIIEALNQNDTFSIHLIEDAGVLIGKGIANLIHLFNPEKIILGGGLTLAGSWLTRPIEQVLHKRCLKRNLNDVTIEKTELGPIASALGSTILILEEILYSKHKKSISLMKGLKGCEGERWKGVERCQELTY